MKKALIALDTDHIKEYVFGTDRLKEIRGASALLNELNRRVMSEKAEDYKLKKIYANGGGGLFAIEADNAMEKAKQFVAHVKYEFQRESGGVLTISSAIQEVPEHINISEDDIKVWFDLLGYKLQLAKNNPPAILALPSHALMRLCVACGKEYAEFDAQREDVQDIDDDRELLCAGCTKKRKKDFFVKTEEIGQAVKRRKHSPKKEKSVSLWTHIIDDLEQTEDGYSWPAEKAPQRPDDFNEFQKLGLTEYMGLIYADGNGMGKAREQQKTCEEQKNFANIVDDSVYEAVASAISKHLPIVKNNNNKHLFPFDILLLGGDDIVMVVPADKALRVALTITQEFEKITEYKIAKAREENALGGKEKKYTLAASVVLAPTKYPFGLLWDLAEDTLKFAKKRTKGNETRINFMTVTGSTSQNFDKVYGEFSSKAIGNESGKKARFCATMRPYDTEQLSALLDAIAKGNKMGLGRTKLHQLREAVLEKNLTTSVNDALTTIRNWRKEQRLHITEHVYQLANQWQSYLYEEDKPGSLFPRIFFPWFLDRANNTFYTNILDFIELYDFIVEKEAETDVNKA